MKICKTGIYSCGLYNCGVGFYNCGKSLYNYGRGLCNGFHKEFHHGLMDKEISNTTGNSIAANSQYRFISKKISVLLLSLICVLTLAACERSSKGSSSTAQILPPPPPGPGPSPISVSNLKVIPNYTNATLSWDNPDAVITQINIIYQNTTADGIEKQVNITDRDDILPNAKVTKTITGLTNGTTYIFRVYLELGGADEERRIIVRERSRQIGPNFDGDKEADEVDVDDDNDGVNDDIDPFPRDKTESADLDNDGVGDNRDLCDYPGSSSNWRNGIDNAVDMDGDGCRGDNIMPEDADDNDATKYAFEVLDLRIIPGAANATFTWNNPDVNIAHINISYKLSTAANFEDPITITDSAKIASNATNVNYNISGLTADIYTFNILLVLGGNDENRSVVTTSITRLIGPNLDGDKYADADPLELDEDGDGVNDEQDAFPRDTTLSIFTVTGLAATPGTNNVTLSWNNPNAQIANISISYKVAGSTDEPLTKSSTQITPDAQETITGLTNGQSYNFTVSLILTGADIDKRVVGASITATPDIFGVRELLAIPGIDNVTLIWNNPDADIASIDISYHNASAPDVLQYLPPITNSSKIGRNIMDVQQFINNLTAGEPYTFIVGLTLNGTYADREVEVASINVTPGVFSVIALQATPGAGNVTLSWHNPNAQIISINISYQIIGSNDAPLIENSAQITPGARNVQETITGLTNGELYSFTVNLTLEGAAAGREGAAPSVTATPDVFSVTELEAIPGVRNVTLSWNNPAKPIASISISYKITGSAAAETTSSTQITPGAQNVQEIITGLTNGESYSFTVSLTLEGDAAGREGAAPSITATPDSFSVTNLTVTPGDSSATLSWNNPDADIFSIRISYRRDGSILQEYPAIRNREKTRKNAMNVQQTIRGIAIAGYYTFAVSLTLDGADAGREGAVLSRRVGVGPNYDGDNLLDFEDTDANNDGEMDNDTDDDGIPDFRDPDRNGDGKIDVDTDNDGEFDYEDRDENGDGVDDIDTDGDGTHDFRDPDANGDGRVDIDTDKDGILNYLDTDDDDDTILDEADVDDDGDGLIEITTAEQFNQVRHNLLGSNFTLSDGGMGNASGCGNGTITGDDITTCNGYELSADISLDNYTNWQPIGSCPTLISSPPSPFSPSFSACTDLDALFSTIFDGNGWIISNLTITNPVAPYNSAAGLFGAINSTAILRNIRIRSASVSGGVTNVGMLVGYAEGATIRNSSAEGDVTASGNNIGGLAGYVSNADIRMSYASGSISGNANVGGLIGYGGTTAIWYSYASGSVSGDNNVGGMVGGGGGLQLDIILSYVVGGSVSATGDYVGGLVGLGSSETRITSSYAAGGDITGKNNVGGLLGAGSFSRIISSYAAPASFSKTGGSTININDYFGGLIGDESIFGAPFPLFSPSADYYWDSQTSGSSVTRTIGNQDGASEGKTTAELRNPITFAGSIYANWATDPCDDDSRAWDLGNRFQYPALTCPPGGVAPQRP